MFCFSSPFGRREGGEGGLSEGSSGIRVEEGDTAEDAKPEGAQDAGKTVVQLPDSGSQNNEICSAESAFNNTSSNFLAKNGELTSVHPVQRLNLTNWNNETALSNENQKCQRKDQLGRSSVSSPLGSAGSSAASEVMGEEDEDVEEEVRRRVGEDDESGCGAGSGTSPSGSSGGVAAGAGGSSDSLLSPSTTPTTPRPGPRFKLLLEGDVQVCVVQHCRGLVGKVLASKFLRRWEMHHLFLNDNCISSRTPTGFLETSVPYYSVEEVHSVARWDASHRFCVRIIIPTGSILLQANNSYTRDQWYHSIVWKKNIYKHRNILRNSTRPEVILREVKSLVSLAASTPLQDECVAHVPLQIVSSLLAEEHPPWTSYLINSPSDEDSGEEAVDDEVEEEMVWAIGPLLEDRPPPPELCRFFSRRCLLRPRSSLVPRIFTPVVHRILKHNVDFGKHPHMRRFVQDYMRALHSHNGGCQVLREFVSSVHGQSSGCPHPRVLPNLVSVCLGAIFSHFEARSRRLQQQRRRSEQKQVAQRGSQRAAPLAQQEEDEEDEEGKVVVVESRAKEEEMQLQCYLTVFLAISEYDDWRPGLAQLLQPIPFPDDAIAHEPFLCGLVPVVRRIGTDPRCEVHQMVLGVREGKEGLFSLYCPTSSSVPSPFFSPMPSPTFPFSPPLFPPSFSNHLCPSSLPNSAPPFPTSCPSSPHSAPPFSAPPFARSFPHQSSSYDDGSLWCEILGTLLNCCCRRKSFVSMLVNRHLGACMLLALRDQPHAQDALCLMLEWNLLGREECKGGRKGTRRRTVRRRIRIGGVPVLSGAENLVVGEILPASRVSPELSNDISESKNVTVFPGLDGDMSELHDKEYNIFHETASDVALNCNVDLKTDVVTSECCASSESELNKTEKDSDNRDKLSSVKTSESDNVTGTVRSKLKPSSLSPIIVGENLAMFSGLSLTTERHSGELAVKREGETDSDLCDDKLDQLENVKDFQKGELIVEVDNGEEEESEEEDEEGDQKTLQVVATLQSTEAGRTRYTALCQRQMHLHELHLLQQQKGGPRKLSLPPRSTDADVCRLVMGVASEDETKRSNEDLTFSLTRVPPYARFGSLECLSLAFTHVTSACAVHLIQIPSLRYLNLWSTQFGDAGLQLICEHLHRLQVLNLCETPVTDKGILWITALKGLRRLNLNSTRLSPETFEKLKAALPALQECDVRYTDAW